jgi:DNA polymerase I
MTIKIIESVPPVPEDNTYVSCDVEMYSMDKNKLHRPTTGKFACVTFCMEPGTVYVVTNPNSVPIALQNVSQAVWLMHNAKFDVMQLRRYASIPPRKKLVDTMLMERILWGGYYDLFSLADLARRYLNIELDKSLQKEFENATELTPELLEYAVTDADVTLKVWQEQKKHITKADMNIWRTVDLPALWAVLDFQGFRIDTKAWEQLAEKNAKKVEEINASLPFNPQSWQQVKPFLIKKGFKGLKATNEKELTKAIHKYPKAEAVDYALRTLESRKYRKRVGTYGKRFLDNLCEKEKGLDLVYADYHVIGAETTRMAAGGAMHSIPIRDTKDYRECFIARPGNKIAILDYDAQEARITAYLTQDKKLIEIFHGKEKVYIVIGREIFGKDIIKGSPEYSKIKSTFLGMDYGMSPYGLAAREGITLDESEDLIARFFKLLPGVKRWTDRQRKLKKYALSAMGLKIWLNPYSGQCENNALNDPHQSTAAHMTKLSLGNLHQEWKFNYPFGVVGVFHDEIVEDVPEKIVEDVAMFTEEKMIRAAGIICPGIPFKVGVEIGDTWGAK